MPYAISEQTAQKLKQLIDDKPGSMVGNGGHVFASRIAGFVRITADETGGIYPATIQVYDVPEAVWKTKDDCLVLEANEKKLTVGERYIAVRYGMNSSDLKSVWVVGVSLPDVGCGLWYDEDDDNTLKVYTPDIAGQGLNHDDTYCQLYIDPGCGITLEGGKKVGVNAEALAGTCLVKEDDCKLGIDLTEQDGPVFSAVTAVNLYGNCYGIYLNWAVTPFNFKMNPCGLFLGFEAGEAFSSSTYVPLGCCCGDDPPPPPPPPPACEGSCEWNYVEGAGWVLVSGGCPEGCYCPQPIDDGLPQSVATTACVPTATTEPGDCPALSTLYGTVSVDGCDDVSFTISNEGQEVTSSWSGSNAMGSCACPGMPVELWDLAVSCTEGAWNVSLAAPTGSTILNPPTIHSTSPVHISSSGTMSCEGPSGQHTFGITIVITE